MISAEWCGFTNIPCGPINFDLEEEAHAMETYQTWRAYLNCNAIIHGSWTAFTSPHAYSSVSSGVWIVPSGGGNNTWAPAGISPRLCDSAAGILSRGKETRLKVSDNPAQYEDLPVFNQELALYHELVAESILPTLKLEFSDEDISIAADKIANWSEGTGGLWAAD